eukprot:3268467-Pyramimonas_sp.AAC.1
MAQGLCRIIQLCDAAGGPRRDCRKGACRSEQPTGACRVSCAKQLGTPSAEPHSGPSSCTFP